MLFKKSIPRDCGADGSSCFYAHPWNPWLCVHAVEAPLFRVPVKPSAGNGLKKTSQAMADKLTTLRRERIGAVIGQLDADDLARVEGAVLRWLGLRA